MAEEKAPFLDGPIPGQSLTAELGNRPWQQPPQYETVEDALEYYIPRLVDPQIAPQLLDTMEMGVPLTTIANAMQVGGVMQGYHTIDVGILVMPVLIEMMAYLAEQAGVDYTIGTEDNRLGDKGYSETTIAKVKRKIDKELEAMGMEPEDLVQEQQAPDVEAEAMPEQQELPPEEPTGLMARRA
jgi:hypothetical protein